MSADSESDAVREFIRGRQADVTARAIKSLELADDRDVLNELHRLTGTLGTYELREVSVALRLLHDELRDNPDSSGGPAVIRQQALGVLLSTPIPGSGVA